MTPELAVEIFRHALLEVFWLAMPILAIGFVVGIVISLVQVLTSIRDTSFSAVPKLLARHGLTQHKGFFAFAHVTAKSLPLRERGDWTWCNPSLPALPDGG